MSPAFFSAPTRSTRKFRSHVGRATISLFAALALLLLGSLASAPAWAHNTLQSTDPADGDTVDQAPDEIVLTFNEPVLDLGNAISVTNPNGDEVVDGDPVVDNDSVTQALSGDLPAGDYEVIWRVTSADGHPIDGEFSFSTTTIAGDDETPEPSEEPSEEPSTEPTTEATDAASEPAEPTPAESETDATATTDSTEETEEVDESTSNTTRNIVIGAGILLLLGGGVAFFVGRAKGKRAQGNQDGQDQPGSPDA